MHLLVRHGVLIISSKNLEVLTEAEEIIWDRI